MRFRAAVAFAAAIGLSVSVPNVTIAQSARTTDASHVAPQTLRDSVVAMARSQIGTPYVLGGENPDGGFDCSGLVHYILAALNLNTPRTAKQQAALGAAVVKDPTHLRPGDLLTFSSGKGGINHIGIYVGNGRMVHASSSAGRVVEVPLDKSTAIRTIWQGARRLLAFVDPRDSSNWRVAAQRLAAASRATTTRHGPTLVALRLPSTSPLLTYLAAQIRPTPKTAFALTPASSAFPSMMVARAVPAGGAAITTRR